MIFKKSHSLEKHDYRNIIKIFLICSILFSSIFIFVSQTFYNIYKNNTIELIVLEKQQRANQFNFIVEYMNKGLVSDLLVIKESDEFKNNIYDLNNEKKIIIQQLFFRIANNKKNFSQIRFLDKNGYELIRVNNNKNNVEIVNDDNLQYKGERYYFNQSKSLKENEYYFSPLDLNIENNEIEIPIKPILRVSTPIYNNNDEFIGVLLINYLGENFFDILNQEFNQIDFNFVNFSLVNNDGYYLYNKDSEKTFSYFFDDKNYNIENEFKSFNDNKNRNELYYKEGNFIYSIKKIVPTNGITTNENNIWYLVSSFNINNIPIVKNRFIYNLSISEFILLLLMNVFIFIFIYILYIKTKDREQLELTTKIANVTNDGVIIADNNKKILFVNKSYEKISGYNFNSLINQTTNFFKSGLHSESFYKKMWMTINREGFWEGELWDRKKDGLLYPKHIKIYAIKKKYSDKIDKYIGIYSDLTKSNENVKNINKLMNYNKLTNLPNEELLLKLVDAKIKNNENFLGLFCFSIINYNEIVYSKTSEEEHLYITNFVREIQILINTGDIFAQITKNSFVVLLSSYENSKGLQNFIENFFNFVKNSNLYNKSDNIIDIKGGVSIYPNIGSTSKKLLDLANVALSQAILTNQDYVFSSHELENEVNKKLQINLLLTKAIVNNELSVNYQPQINNDTNKVVGAEALMRWHNPTLGDVSPFFFIPLAEKSGFIVDLGYWIIEKVFSDYNQIKDDLPLNFKFSINISPIQFKDNNLLNKIIELSNKYNVNLSNFEIELTESVLVADINQVNDKLNKFKRLGFSIALDDFGTGFSSLSYLKKMEIDKIKIDRAFIKDYPKSDNGEIAKIIVNIAKELNLKVITEGVETKEQLDYIESINCCCIQGYYFSKPLSFINFKEYINNF